MGSSVHPLAGARSSGNWPVSKGLSFPGKAYPFLGSDLDLVETKCIYHSILLDQLDL
jgi:hypothetical protein